MDDRAVQYTRRDALGQFPDDAEMREAVAAVELVLGATAPSAESDLTVTEALSLLAGAMVLVLRFLGEGAAGC